MIVNEPWWTATAKRADIVFPATTSYEREDIGRTFSDPFLFAMPKMIEPVVNTVAAPYAAQSTERFPSSARRKSHVETTAPRMRNV